MLHQRTSLRLFGSVLVFVAGLLSLSPLQAQTVVGVVNGTVRDQSGAIVAGSEVTIRNLDTSAARNAVSGSTGGYVIPSVPPGRYSLTATLQGFQTYLLKEFRLQVNEARTIDVQMAVGEVSETMTVSDVPPPLHVSDATIGTVIQSKEIVQIPLNGRHFTQLILLAPGTSPVQTGQQGLFMISQGAGGISPAVNGMRPQMNNFTIDGIDNNMRFTNSFATSPPPDAIQEFKVATNQSDAQASLAAGASINLVTRSGGNDFHGSVWEFLRNDKLAAKNYFDNFFNRPKLPYRQNQYGFFVGGPIYVPKIVNGRKTRSFFSTYWEGFKSRRSSTTAASTPDQATRSGNFSQFLGSVIGVDALGREIRSNQIYDPLTTRACAACPSGFIRDPFPNNVIPSDRIHPVAKAYMNALYPLPNASTFPNFVLAQSTKQDSNQFGVRIDHNFSDNRKIFGRFSWFKTEQRSPGSLPANPFEQNNNGVNGVLQYTHVFNPTFLMDLQAGYNRAAIPFRNVPLGNDFRSAVGPNFAIGVPNGFLPTTMALGGSRFSTPSFVNFDLANPDYSYQYNADFKKIKGNHDISFGFRFMPWRHIVGHQGSTGIDFAPQTTNQPGFLATGDSLASFFLGFPTGSVYGFANPLQTYGQIYVGYLGDNWKITPKLTFNLGLQYVYASPPVARADRISLFDYPTALTRPNSSDFAFAYIWSGTNPITGQAANSTRRSIMEPDKNNVAPRFGLAYRVHEKTVIQAGFGVFFDYNTNLVQNSIRVAFNNWPYALGQQVTGQNLTVLGPNNPIISLNNPFITATPTPPAPRNTLNRFNRDPYVLQWNFGIERTLPANLILSANYLGSGGKNLVLNTVENIAPAGPGPVNPRRPLPSSGSFILLSNEGLSTYHAMQLTVERRFSSGFSFRNAYTWSKSLDLESDPNAAGIEYAYNWHGSKGPSDYDITHMNVMSYVYELPFGKGRKFGSSLSGAANHVLAGWQVAGIYSIRSGRRFTVFAGQDSANTGTFLPGLLRANVFTDPVPSGFNQARAAWFDIKAFGTPAFGTLGTSSRNFMTGPGTQVFDISISKDFLITETTGIEFRSEFFNAFNHTNLGNPVSSLASPVFGQIFGAGAARDIQFALKFHW